MNDDDVSYGFCDSNEYARAFVNFEMAGDATLPRAASAAISSLMMSTSQRKQWASTLLILTWKDMLSLALGGPAPADRTQVAATGALEVPTFASFVMPPLVRLGHRKLPKFKDIKLSSSPQDLERTLRKCRRCLIYDRSSFNIDEFKRSRQNLEQVTSRLGNALTITGLLQNIGEPKTSCFFELTTGAMDCVWPRSDTQSIAHGAMNILVESINYVEVFKEQRKLFNVT